MAASVRTIGYSTVAVSASYEIWSRHAEMMAASAGGSMQVTALSFLPSSLAISMPTILIIEEDISLRSLFKEWLTASDYKVWFRSEVPANRESDVNLVIVDLRNLPTQASAKVSNVKNAFPVAQVIGVSTQLTCAMSGDSSLARTLGVGALLPKPCTHDELLAAAREALLRERT
jgi:DNA-binding NtrC family response regulator